MLFGDVEVDGNRQVIFQLALDGRGGATLKASDFHGGSWLVRVSEHDMQDKVLVRLRVVIQLSCHDVQYFSLRPQHGEKYFTPSFTVLLYHVS